MAALVVLGIIAAAILAGIARHVYLRPRSLWVTGLLSGAYMLVAMSFILSLPRPFASSPWLGHASVTVAVALLIGAVVIGTYLSPALRKEETPRLRRRRRLVLISLLVFGLTFGALLSVLEAYLPGRKGVISASLMSASLGGVAAIFIWQSWQRRSWRMVVLLGLAWIAAVPVWVILGLEEMGWSVPGPVEVASFVAGFPGMLTIYAVLILNSLKSRRRPPSSRSDTPGESAGQGNKPQGSGAL